MSYTHKHAHGHLWPLQLFVINPSPTVCCLNSLMAINRPDYNPISRLSHDGELGGTLTKRWAEIEYERRYLSWHRPFIFHKSSFTRIVLFIVHLLKYLFVRNTFLLLKHSSLNTAYSELIAFVYTVSVEIIRVDRAVFMTSSSGWAEVSCGWLNEAEAKWKYSSKLIELCYIRQDCFYSEASGDCGWHRLT